MDRQIYIQRLEALEEIRQDDHHALRIAMCGKFKSGKSSLLNLMLGVKLPVKSTTATGIITKIIYGNISAVKMQNKEIKNVSEQELFDYISVVEKDLDGIMIGEAICAYLGSHSKLLRRGKVEFWDTPGLEDDPGLTKITMDAIRQCDFLVYVMHATQVLSQYEKRIFPKLYKMMNGNMVFVVNHMDSLRSDEMNSVVLSVCRALEGYRNDSFPNGNVFFTSANPGNPEISMFLEGISQMCCQKENRINILNLTKQGKLEMLEEEWRDEICEDIENIEQGIQKYQQLIMKDIEKKRGQLEKCYIHCVNHCKQIQKNLEEVLRDESAWRRVLVDYQSVQGWEVNFVNGASARIKERMARLIKKGNEDIWNVVYGSIFETDYGSIILDEWTVWKKVNWYRNFSRPLFFPEMRFKQYQKDCIEICISSLMENAVVIVKNSICQYFSQFFSSLYQHYQIAASEINGAPELLYEFQNMNADKEFVINYQDSAAAIRDDVHRAERRSGLLYQLKDFFSLIFTGMLSDEIYN